MTHFKVSLSLCLFILAIHFGYSAKGVDRLIIESSSEVEKNSGNRVGQYLDSIQSPEISEYLQESEVPKKKTNSTEKGYIQTSHHPRQLSTLPYWYVATKINVPLFLIGVTNIGIEASIPQTDLSIDFPIIYSPYTISRSYKLKLLFIQPEVRYWTHRPLLGHFFGVHTHLGHFNVAFNELDRYQTNRLLWGAGLSYGYLVQVSDNIGFEFTCGVGYANVHYDTYFNVNNGISHSTGKKGYWGVTKLGINLLFKLGL